MFRIFEIDDLKEIRGLSVEFVVQEKYYGMRIQIHKVYNNVKIYSFLGTQVIHPSFAT